MKIIRSLPSLVVAAGLALAALGGAGAAQAQNINWSVGVSSPGVQLGFTNAQPVYVQQPMYQPVYVAPRPVYVVQPQYVEVGWQHPGRGYGWHRKHRHHDDDDDDDDRDEGRGHRGHRGHR